MQGEHLDRLASGEFEGRCAGCDSYLSIVLGELGFFVSTEDWDCDPEAPRSAIQPADARHLPPVGSRLHTLASSAGQAEVARWIRHLFGTFLCIPCGEERSVHTAIEAECL